LSQAQSHYQPSGGGVRSTCDKGGGGGGGGAWDIAEHLRDTARGQKVTVELYLVKLGTGNAWRARPVICAKPPAERYASIGRRKLGDDKAGVGHREGGGEHEQKSSVDRERHRGGGRGPLSQEIKPRGPF